MALKFQSSPPLDAPIEEPLYINDCTYIPEPSMEEGKSNFLKNNALIPHSIVGTIYTFIGPLPRGIKKPRVPKKLFTCFLSYEPLVFVDTPFDFSFFKNQVFRYSPSNEDAYYIQWLDMVQEKRKIF